MDHNDFHNVGRKNQQKQLPERMKNPMQSDDNTSLGHLDKGR